MGARPGEVAEAARVVPVARRPERVVQINEREPAMGDEQAVGEKERAWRRRGESYGELAPTGNPLVGEMRVQELAEVGRTHARRERRTGVAERLLVIAGE